MFPLFPYKNDQWERGEGEGGPKRTIHLGKEALGILELSGKKHRIFWDFGNPGGKGGERPEAAEGGRKKDQCLGSRKVLHIII